MWGINEGKAVSKKLKIYSNEEKLCANHDPPFVLPTYTHNGTFSSVCYVKNVCVPITGTKLRR